MKDTNPFRVPIHSKFIAATLEKALGLKPLITAYDSRRDNLTSEQFLDYTLASLKVQVTLQGSSLNEELPESGPVIVVANHPFGGLDGVALTRAVLSVRPDTKVLTNQMLSRIPEFHDVFLGVDVLSKNATAHNLQSVRHADKHLARGGVLIVFPAGEVSAARWNNFSVQDKSWNSMVGRLALKHRASCLPIYIHGRNPAYFYAAGLIHKRLRTLLLPRQLSNKIGYHLKMTIGKRLSEKECTKSASAQALTLQLRMSTYFLAPTKQLISKKLAPVSEVKSSIKQSQLLKDIEHLAPFQLLRKSEFSVYCAPFKELNSVFLALAEAREITFRAAGEGTGNPYDHDQYDKHYLHLFVWDHKNNAIVGGYRLGETDKIIAQQGVAGLYSRSLYKFDERYMEKFGCALEVGRSFVTQAYQRHPSALDLLWRGIGRFVAQHPQYSKLFGCVSISSEHSTMARAFISDAMMESYRAEQRFLDDVKPLVPLKVKNKIWTKAMLAAIQDIAVFNKLVGLCEPGKTVPVLLRHYVALNGKFIGFSINRGFNDSLDGLILVDLHQMPERYLNRYLTKEGAELFKQHREQNERVN
ncbi:lysophospholipid acyltransferase family protein [Reinekea marina]|uniref:L-ornithine N(alpha)-acyltransferase n=1 Tax=Reinekea marina TaxID=1310421 RepID=A0ABV7WSM0_9GAMM|nr:lysophospholipid acyltransferase family protein [Reinekea marina]MDN3648949.1 lysophospholipid acyltransferase family protein [Reinekea marina]